MQTNFYLVRPTIKWPSWQGLKNTPTASLQKSKTLIEYPGYDTKQFDGFDI